MRALALLPIALLAACQVTEDPANNQTTVSISGDAAKNGVAAGLDAVSNTVEDAANKVDEVSNSASDVRTGVANVGASVDKLGRSVEKAADSLGDAVDGKKRVTVTTETTRTETNSQ